MPLPALTADEYGEVAARAFDLLPHEYFRPGTWGAAGVMQLPYSKAVINAALHYRVAAAIRGVRPTYAPFYQPDHPSGALPVTATLLTEVAIVAAAREQRFIVLLIPDLHDLDKVRDGEPASYAPLRAALEDAGLEWIDAADYLVAQYPDGDFCDLFVTCGASHFNPDGYRLLAEAVHVRLSR